MSIFSKKEKEAQPQKRAKRIQSAIKLARPILRAVYYAMIICILLAAIVALIMLFVNTSVEQMMLPPLMQLKDGTYSITIGNGIRIDATHESVSLGDIKTVIYAQLMLFAASCAIIAPVALFLSKLLGGISEHDPKGARYISYIGLCVMVASTFIRLARSFYNFLLVKTFVSEPDAIRFAFELPLGGIAMGVIILVFAYVYKGSCEKHAQVQTLSLVDIQE